jgi:hypothetical protein
MKARHHIAIEPAATADRRLVVRCTCGWMQAASGWMLESSADEVRRLVAEHLAAVAGLAPAVEPQPERSPQPD